MATQSGRALKGNHVGKTRVRDRGGIFLPDPEGNREQRRAWEKAERKRAKRREGGAR
jgi:hypothetical protein